MESNSKNANILLVVVLAAIVFFVFILPMLDRESNKRNNKVLSNCGYLDEDFTTECENCKTLSSAGNRADCMETHKCPVEQFKNDFGSNDNKKIGGLSFGSYIDRNNGPCSIYDDVVLPGIVKTTNPPIVSAQPKTIIKAEVVPSALDSIATSVIGNDEDYEIEGFESSILAPYNGDAMLMKVDTKKCSKACCKHVQWPVPFNPVAEDAKNVLEGDVKKVISSNMTCNSGNGSGCVCIDQDDFNVLSKRSGNGGNSMC